MSVDDKAAILIIFGLFALVILTVETLKAFDKQHDERTNRDLQSARETLQDQAGDR